MDRFPAAEKARFKLRGLLVTAAALALFLPEAFSQPAGQDARGPYWELVTPGTIPPGGIFPVDRIVGAFGNVSPLYLIGTFNVTASGQTRCILRHDGQRSYRFIVDFPRGAQIPPEGSVVNRDVLHPFLVREVRQSPDGQTNLYLREVVLQESAASAR